MTLTLGSLCSGAGMLDAAVSQVLGSVRHAWVAENDPDASRVLAERFGVPNLGDLTAVDWRRVEPVDVLVAGFPCQPFSVAGKRKGTDDERWIWPDIASAVRDLRPRLVCLENPPGILAPAGIGRVVGDLAGLGYVGSWRSLRASELGAPHQRTRVFVVAHHPGTALLPTPVARDHKGRGRPGQLGTALLPTPVASTYGSNQSPSEHASVRPSLETIARMLLPTPTANAGEGRTLNEPDHAQRRRDAGRRMLDDAVALLPTPIVKDSTGGPRRPPARRTHGGPDFGAQLRDVALPLPTPTATDANASRNATASRSHIPATTNHTGWTLHDVAYADRWAQYGPAIAQWEAILGRPAPDPTVVGKRGGRRLSGRFVEWLMGWPEGWVTDLVDNTAALRICGNGVVPLQGAAAYRELLAVADAAP